MTEHSGKVWAKIPHLASWTTEENAKNSAISLTLHESQWQCVVRDAVTTVTAHTYSYIYI
jgi:hypothetical protein